MVTTCPLQVGTWPKKAHTRGMATGGERLQLLRPLLFRASISEVKRDEQHWEIRRFAGQPRSIQDAPWQRRSRGFARDASHPERDSTSRTGRVVVVEFSPSTGSGPPAARQMIYWLDDTAMGNMMDALMGQELAA